MNTEICACLGEWYKDAQSKGKENFARAFQKALKSVEKFPDVITSVEQTRGIKGVGPYIAARIEKHFRESGRDGSSTFRRTRTGNVEKKSRTYDPKYRSAPFALLVALRETEIELDTLNMPLPKAELIAIAQRHCDEPLVKAVKGPAGGRFTYDGWSSMGSTLVKKGLVTSFSNPRQHALTSEGRSLADKLLLRIRAMTRREILQNFDAEGTVTTPLKSRDSAQPQDAIQTTQEVVEQDTAVRVRKVGCHGGASGGTFVDGSILDPVENALAFELVLLIDNREVFGSGCTRDGFRRKLKEGSSFSVEVGLLEAGDAVFVARTTGDHCGEYVLDYLVERKTVKDYVDSIKDGRYERQKYFMQQSGLEHLLFVVEGDLAQQTQIPAASLQKEITRSNVHDKFLVFQTKSLEETIRLYSGMHKWIHRKYAKWSVMDIARERKTLEQWNEEMKLARETRVEDVFWQMMLQIPGLGRTKVRKLLNGSSVRSFAGLLDRYARNDEASRPKLLSDLLSDGRTNVDLSESVYRLFCARDYGDGRFKPRKSVVSRGQDSVKSSVPSSTPSREHSAGRSGSMEIARTDAQQRSSRLTETSERSIPPLPPPQTMRSFPQSPHERCEDLPAAPVGEVSDVETRNASVREKTTAGSRLHSWREQPGNGTATTVGSVLQSYSFTTDAASRAPIILD